MWYEVEDRVNLQLFELVADPERRWHGGQATTLSRNAEDCLDVLIAGTVYLSLLDEEPFVVARYGGNVMCAVRHWPIPSSRALLGSI